MAYYRVSTERQWRSGLGLDAQRTAVKEYLDGGRWRLIGEYTEVESGKRNDRPQLAKALHHAKVTGARLVIAKLDRLSRNAAFLLTLRDSGVRFVAADVPDANELTIGVLALVAQHERERISERTKAARRGEEAWREAGQPQRRASASPRASQARQRACRCGCESAGRDVRRDAAPDHRGHRDCRDHVEPWHRPGAEAARDSDGTRQRRGLDGHHGRATSCAARGAEQLMTRYTCRDLATAKGFETIYEPLRQHAVRLGGRGYGRGRAQSALVEAGASMRLVGVLAGVSRITVLKNRRTRAGRVPRELVRAAQRALAASFRNGRPRHR